MTGEQRVAVTATNFLQSHCKLRIVLKKSKNLRLTQSNNLPSGAGFSAKYSSINRNNGLKWLVPSLVSFGNNRLCSDCVGRKKDTNKIIPATP